MDAATREFVRNRAGNRCEYCHFLATSLPYFVFHIDHIVAKQHLDVVDDNPDGLAWSCSECNYHKGPNIATIDPETLKKVELFDPRSDLWDDHFEVRHGRIEGLSAIGRATVRLLNMNANRLVRIRRELIALGEF